MTPEEFKAIRLTTGMDQSELAKLLGYSGPVRVSELETGLKPVTHKVGLIMLALKSGWRPE
jgi:DNA-binding transcriptional regulator YiaG